MRSRREGLSSTGKPHSLRRPPSVGTAALPGLSRDICRQAAPLSVPGPHWLSPAIGGLLLSPNPASLCTGCGVGTRSASLVPPTQATARMGSNTRSTEGTHAHAHAHASSLAALGADPTGAYLADVFLRSTGAMMEADP